MRIRWTQLAAADLEEISDYLLTVQPALAQPTVKRLYEAAMSLKSMPYRGRSGEEGERELILSELPYLIVYRIKNDSTRDVANLAWSQETASLALGSFLFSTSGHL